MTKQFRTTTPQPIDEVTGRPVDLSRVDATYVRWWERQLADAKHAEANARTPRTRDAGFYDQRIENASTVDEARFWRDAKAAFMEEQEEAREFAALKQSVAELQELIADVTKQLEARQRATREQQKQAVLSELLGPLEWPSRARIEPENRTSEELGEYMTGGVNVEN